PPACLAGAAEAAERECVTLLAAAGLDAADIASWPTAVEADSPISTDRLASLPLCVYSGHKLLTQLATLDAGWLGAGRTHLSLSMSYDAQLDQLGEVNELRDRALLHRVHEAVA